MLVERRGDDVASHRKLDETRAGDHRRRDHEEHQPGRESLTPRRILGQPNQADQHHRRRRPDRRRVPVQADRGHAAGQYPGARPTQLCRPVLEPERRDQPERDEDVHLAVAAEKDRPRAERQQRCGGQTDQRRGSGRDRSRRTPPRARSRRWPRTVVSQARGPGPRSRNIAGGLSARSEAPASVRPKRPAPRSTSIASMAARWLASTFETFGSSCPGAAKRTSAAPTRSIASSTRSATGARPAERVARPRRPRNRAAQPPESRDPGSDRGQRRWFDPWSAYHTWTALILPESPEVADDHPA